MDGKRKRRRYVGMALLLPLMLVVAVSIVAAQMASQYFKIPTSVLCSGGGQESSANFRVQNSVGQPVTGKCESANYKAYIGFWSAKPIWVVGVEEEFAKTSTLPKVYSLYQNYPNPMSYATKIEYSLPKVSHVTLKIYNISGQLVETLVEESQTPGCYRVVWNGQDNSGNKVPSGIYFYQIKAEISANLGRNLHFSEFESK